MNFYEYELKKEAEERQRSVESSDELFDYLPYKSKTKNKSHKRHQPKKADCKKASTNKS